MHGKKKWMSKKFIVILLSGAALFGFPAVASAENQTIFADDDILYYSEDYEEVKQLNDEIEADLEYVLKDEGIDADVELDEEFYKKAVSGIRTIKKSPADEAGDFAFSDFSQP